MLYILCLCACPQTCIFRLTLQIIKSLENLNILVVVWTGSECTPYQSFAVLWVKPFGEKGCSKASKSITPEGVINSVLVNTICFGFMQLILF